MTITETIAAKPELADHLTNSVLDSASAKIDELMEAGDFAAVAKFVGAIANLEQSI